MCIFRISNDREKKFCANKMNCYYCIIIRVLSDYFMVSVITNRIFRSCSFGLPSHLPSVVSHLHVFSTLFAVLVSAAACRVSRKCQKFSHSLHAKICDSCFEWFHFIRIYSSSHVLGMRCIPINLNIYNTVLIYFLPFRLLLFSALHV